MMLKERIVQEILIGGTPSEIAARVGCSSAYVCNLKNERVNRQYERLGLSKKIQVAYLWGADHCVTSIAEKLGLGKLQIINFLQREGLIDAKPE